MADLSTNLRTWVSEHLTGEDPQAAALVLAAFDGADAVEATLAGGHPDQDPTPTEAPTVDNVLLKRLTVEAFRGIGRATTLYLQPTPGLTIVSGRNGSGKSSLADGLEVALTGRTYRWDDKARTTQFDPAWRNLHTKAEPAISLTLTRSGVADDLTIDVAWPNGESDKTKLTQSVRIGDQTADMGSLGWENALKVFRPMLSYEELGQSLLQANQKATAEAFERGLGLQQLTAATGALNAVMKQSKSASTDETGARAELRGQLEGSTDERAASLLAALPGRITTTAKVAPFRDVGAIVTDQGPVAVLTAIADIEPPTAAEATARAQRLRDASAAYADLRDQAETLDARRRDLLSRALDLHSHLGDEATCPVCGLGALDEDWATRTRATLAETESHAKAVADADAELRAARSALTALVSARPAHLGQDHVELAAQPLAQQVWTAWGQLPADHDAAADHVESRVVEVVEATEQWRTQARDEAVARRDAWAPVAQAIVRWLDTFDRYCDETERRTRLQAAQKLMKTVTEKAREHQIAPIRERAQAMWSLLRHESNVSLGDLKVTSTKLEIPAEVDGESAGALQVMSQGELHALALALFLPRAASDASPFRFVVLDDPVQAMDPAKVEGLLSVLLELASTRQVVVFSHDDRLAAAARRRVLGEDSAVRLQTVERGAKSDVSIKLSGDAAGRYLQEAGSFLKDPKVGAGLKGQVAGGLFRMAIEAAARDAWFRDGVRRGVPLDTLEDQWTKAKGTKKRVALSVGVSDCWEWFSWDHPHRKPAVESCNEGSHSGLDPAQLDAAMTQVYKTVQDLRKTHG